MSTITVCDVCGEKNGVERVSFVVDRRMDPAGSMDDVCKTIDICQKHFLLATKIVLKQFSNEFGNRYYGNRLIVDAIDSMIRNSKKGTV